MKDTGSQAPTPWHDAMYCTALFAVDPAGTGGISVRTLPGPVRQRWLAQTCERLAEPNLVKQVPLNISDDRLLGGLDLTATLHSGRPVAQSGLLAEANGGVLLLSMAERIQPNVSTQVTAALDTGQVVLERDGFAERHPARVGVIALDEGVADDERPPEALLDRLAFHVSLEGISVRDMADEHPVSAEQIERARNRLHAVSVSDEIIEGLCGTAIVLGIRSLRAPLLALKVARAAAALNGRGSICEDDTATAARLVFASRATMFPSDSTEENDEQNPEQNHEDENAGDEPNANTDAADEPDSEKEPGADVPLQELVLDAVQAALPADLLQSLKTGSRTRSPSRITGKAGAFKYSALRGRPAGVVRTKSVSGARLNVVETLRTAAPWQRVRQRSRLQPDTKCIRVRGEDLRVNRFKQRNETVTIFVVDASGSSALNRLAEAKGAVELLLADCYTRRDRVALIAFRGTTSELLLPATRSLVRAKRSLAGLPGGGATPLACGIDAARILAASAQGKGWTPTIVLLTDGRANVARSGEADRTLAQEDALASARLLKIDGTKSLLVDTSPRRQPSAEAVAANMGAKYLPLPRAGADAISRAVLSSAQAAHQTAH